MVGLLDGKKTLRIYVLPFRQNTGVLQIDRQTDGQTSCHGIVRAMHMRRAVKMVRYGRQLKVIQGHRNCYQSKANVQLSL